jgi:hypothetical protein
MRVLIPKKSEYLDVSLVDDRIVTEFIPKENNLTFTEGEEILVRDSETEIWAKSIFLYKSELKLDSKFVCQTVSADISGRFTTKYKRYKFAKKINKFAPRDNQIVVYESLKKSVKAIFQYHTNDMAIILSMENMYQGSDIQARWNNTQDLRPATDEEILLYYKYIIK